MLDAYPLLSAYKLLAFDPFFIKRIYTSRIIIIKNLHALKLELKLLRKLQENRLLQPTGDAMGTGHVMIIGGLMPTGEAEVQSVQTMLYGEFLTLRDVHFLCWPPSKLELSLLLVSVASE